MNKKRLLSLKEFVIVSLIAVLLITSSLIFFGREEAVNST